MTKYNCAVKLICEYSDNKATGINSNPAQFNTNTNPSLQVLLCSRVNNVRLTLLNTNIFNSTHA